MLRYAPFIAPRVTSRSQAVKAGGEDKDLKGFLFVKMRGSSEKA